MLKFCCISASTPSCWGEFKTKVQVGDHVRPGDLLTLVDWDYIRKKGCDTIVPILAINRKVKLLKGEENVKPGEALFEIEA